MILIVGLGNPGKEYEKTYHNLGFMALDYYAKLQSVKITKNKENALIFEGQLNGKKVILAKPQTYMNLSGTSVIRLMNAYKIDPSQVLIIYDDIDLEEAAVRFRSSGSAGTHNGMKDILKNVNTLIVPRIRIGVGKDPLPNRSLADFVLSSVRDEKVYDAAFQKTASIIDEFILNNGVLENKSAV